MSTSDSDVNAPLITLLAHTRHLQHLLDLVACRPLAPPETSHVVLLYLGSSRGTENNWIC
jgi:hypothetical protein